MKRLFACVVLSAFGAAPLLAGDAAPVVVEPEPAVTAQPSGAAGGLWTGGYAGVQLGQLDADTSGGLNGDDTSYGVHGGYRYDFGRFVLGGEVDYDLGDLDLGSGVGVDSVLRGKVQAGYDLGSAFAYVTGGVAELESSLGRETGKFYGLGVVYSVTDEFTLGGEILDHSFDGVGGGTDVDATTVTIRGSFNF